jgi:photosynthetic reaction center cytochrome c subunit
MSAFVRVSLAALAAASALLTGCGERPPVDTVQHGYRGTGMQLVYNPRLVAEQIPLNQPPPAPGPLNNDGPKAKDVYQNVKVLGDLSVANFTRHMASITQWVSPKEGCNYCHNAQNFADDSKYTKVVARRMIQMTQHVNADWKNHVGNTGVTCYTCHRGNPVPSNAWFTPLAQDKKANFIGDLAGQNQPSPVVGLASLPNDPFTPYLKDVDEAKVIRVIGKTALPTDNRASTKQAEHTYGLMVHMSTSLGVNCTFCHNSRSFASWEGPPQRATAWYGIRLARDLNHNYLEPLTTSFPQNRLGTNGDVAKVNCATCHQGAYKPVYGAQMAKDFPELLAPLAAAATPLTGTLPPPVAETLRSVMYFGVGAAVLQGEQAKGLTQLVARMTAQPALKATISGYHSASGALDQNQDLAKRRAFAVRDALLGAGVTPDRVVLEKPLQAEANLAGEDPAARRVEVTVK